MAVASQVYAEQLSTLGHGYPLFFPDLPKESDITIGDVGYVDSDGAFWRLFNATKPKGHALNKEGVPEGSGNHELLLYDSARHGHTKDHYLNSQALCSKGIVAVEAQANIGGGGSKLSYKFKSSKRQGALLIIDDIAQKEVARDQRRFRKHMEKYRDSWHDFAAQCGHDIKKEDLVFVYGWVKTTSWAVASLVHMNGEHEFTLNSDIAGIGKAGISFSKTTEISPSVQGRSGPLGRSPGEGRFDQTVFVLRVKFKSRSLFNFTMKAGAGPHQLPDGGDDDDGGSSDVGPTGSPNSSVYSETGSKVETRDLLDDLLTYILQNSSCSIATASDDDVLDLLPDDDSDTFVAHLEKVQPRIVVDDLDVGEVVLSVSDSVPSPSSSTSVRRRKRAPRSSDREVIKRRRLDNPQAPAPNVEHYEALDHNAEQRSDVAVVEPSQMLPYPPITPFSPWGVPDELEVTPSTSATSLTPTCVDEFDLWEGVFKSLRSSPEAGEYPPLVYQSRRNSRSSPGPC